jgi:hypothetical protein
MTSNVTAMLFPILKVAQFLGLLPCHQVRNDQLLHSKRLTTVLNFFFTLVLAPAGVYYLFLSASRPVSETPVGSSILLACVTFSHTVSISFLVIYRWHFVSNSCAVLSKAMSVFVFAEKETSEGLLKFRLLILVYQYVGLLASFSLCLAFVIRFSMATNWQIQLVINFTRMQIFTIELCINMLNYIFIIFFQRISISLKQLAKRTVKMKVEFFAATVRF